MLRKYLIRLGAAAVTAFSFAVVAPYSSAQAEDLPRLLVSVQDQQMALVRNGSLVTKYPISTSRFGLGDAHGSYKTPLGRMRVCEKYGDELAMGAVLKGRAATGEILQVNAPGRDPIVTRILWLEGLEEQNRNARGRAIYIHGTPEERNLGKPVSWGCIRMRSSDVAALYEQIPVGAEVLITRERLPRMPKYDPKREPIIASTTHYNPPVPSSPVRTTSLPPKRDPAITFSGPGFPKNTASRSSASDAMKGSILFSGISQPATSTEGQQLADRRAAIEMLQRAPQ